MLGAQRKEAVLLRDRGEIGEVVQFAVCDWYVQAVRRLAAVTGGHRRFAFEETMNVPSRLSRPRSSGARPAGRQYSYSSCRSTCAIPWTAQHTWRASMARRADGTWEGWIEFVAIGAAVVLRTDQGTTQSNRAGVAY